MTDTTDLALDNGHSTSAADDQTEEASAELVVATASGLYAWKASAPVGDDDAGAPAASIQREELRVDVDGRYPQMTLSGTIVAFGAQLHWIAKLTPRGRDRWTGAIWYKDGAAALLPHTTVDVTVGRSVFPNLRWAKVTFGGPGLKRVRKYRFESPAFHPVELEFDRTADSTPITSIAIGDHPNRPASLPLETVSLETIYRRAGFAVRKSGGDGEVPKALANSDGVWNEAEMHDAMQVYWSRFANAPQWSLWVFWAAQSYRGTSLGGVMFDDIGPNHRQGTAIFTDSFIAQAPTGDPAPAAWVRRMKFWTAAHEMGHAFNLAHAWQKQHPPTWGNSWIPLVNDPESRSFMNYPYNVAGGESAFFADFAFRFIDPELLFMRHAPARFVQMGNANWFEDHGFENEKALAASQFRLEVRANRDTSRFAFLEPVVLELKLTNVSDRPQIIDKQALDPAHGLTAVIARAGRPARQWMPFARACTAPEPIVLAAGESLYESLPIYAGVNGWDISEPGAYEVQVALNIEDGFAVSDPLRVIVEPPTARNEEVIAPDVFTDEVGRALRFGGTRAMSSAVDTLQEVTSQLPESRLALHAAYTLANPLARPYKLLEIPKPASGQLCAAVEANGKVRTADAQPEEASTMLHDALLAPSNTAAETFGHVDYKRKVDDLSQVLADSGESRQAAETQSALRTIMSERNVASSVLKQIAGQEESYAKQSRSAKKRKQS